MKETNNKFPNLKYKTEDIWLQSIFKEFDSIFSTERSLNNMFIGAIRVLFDDENLDKFSQASNSIINIFDELIHTIGFLSSKEKILEEEDLDNLKILGF